MNQEKSQECIGPFRFGRLATSSLENLLNPVAGLAGLNPDIEYSSSLLFRVYFRKLEVISSMGQFP